MTTLLDKIDIRVLSKEDLEGQIVALGESKFRSKQIFQWIWEKGATNFMEMTNLSLGLREKLAEHYTINSMMEDFSQTSSDGTIKTRWKLHDGHLIESVLIPSPNMERMTVCVSTQVGCSLSCSFCATGKMDRARNLTAAEIHEQVVKVNHKSMAHYNRPVSNVVYMGMGEPLLNYKETFRSYKRLSAHSPVGYGLGMRRLTISTAGIAKMIRKLADDGFRGNLALSLHAADDDKRSKIMPINDSNKLYVLMEALEYFNRTTKARISYEYIAFAGFNDSLDDADKLIQLCKRNFKVFVNIIEYNTVEGVPFVKTDDDQLDRFAKYLSLKGVTVTVRRSRGKDIDAACGQLANKDK